MRSAQLKLLLLPLALVLVCFPSASPSPTQCVLYGFQLGSMDSACCSWFSAHAMDIIGGDGADLVSSTTCSPLCHSVVTALIPDLASSLSKDAERMIADFEDGCGQYSPPTLSPTVSPTPTGASSPTFSPTPPPSSSPSSASPTASPTPPAPPPAPPEPPAAKAWLPWALPLMLSLLASFLALGTCKTPNRAYFLSLVAAAPREQKRLGFTVIFVFGLATALLVGQSLTSFYVSYSFRFMSIDIARSTSYDFWTGCSKLWSSDSKFLAVLLALFTGIWPFFKHALTARAVLSRSLHPPSPSSLLLESSRLHSLGLLGRSSLLDVAVVCSVVSLLDLSLSVPSIPFLSPGGGGRIAATPGAGLLIIAVVLGVGTALTALLAHVWTERSAAEVAGGGAAAEEDDRRTGGGKAESLNRQHGRSLLPLDVELAEAEGKETRGGDACGTRGKPLLLLLGASVCFLLVVVGLFCPAAIRSYEVTYTPPSSVPFSQSITVSSGSETYTIPRVIVDSFPSPSSKSSSSSDASTRTVVGIITMMCCVVFPLVHSVSILLASFLLAFPKQWDDSASLLCRLSKFAAALSELAALDVFGAALLVLGLELPALSAAISDEVNNELKGLGEGKFFIEIESKAAVWAAILGGVGSAIVGARLGKVVAAQVRVVVENLETKTKPKSNSSESVNSDVALIYATRQVAL